MQSDCPITFSLALAHSRLLSLSLESVLQCTVKQQVGGMDRQLQADTTQANARIRSIRGAQAAGLLTGP